MRPCAASRRSCHDPEPVATDRKYPRRRSGVLHRASTLPAARRAIASLKMRPCAARKSAFETCSGPRSAIAIAYTSRVSAASAAVHSSRSSSAGSASATRAAYSSTTSRLAPAKSSPPPRSSGHSESAPLGHFTGIEPLFTSPHTEKAAVTVLIPRPSDTPRTPRITTAFKAQPVLPNGPMRAWRLPSATKRTERTGHSLLIRY